MSDTDENTPPAAKQRSPALFNDVEDKTNEARSKFDEIPECIYINKHIGDSGQNEQMTCDCVEDWDLDTRMNLACGEDSDCINRVTSVECINKYCSCGKNCENQRFQKKQYANVSVFQTELKGYGVKANADIPESSFIYEYIGEVIDETSFRQRMIEYDQNNFKHFYFMMLTKEAFIDATVKGSLARFVNHSCNPNAYVDKWVVGDKLRMGIFAKRNVRKGEEITFDYNVDRYGAQSQPCYCGEPNCIKFMGGKTQTDAALLLPDGISEALGVTQKQERQWLKDNKHLRANQQDDDSIINEYFVKSIDIQPILAEIDVSKIMGALMKVEDINILSKLIERINLTNDSKINSIIVKFHGYKTLSKIMKDLKDVEDNDGIIEMILEILNRWPKVTRNKIESSQIEDVVKEINANTNNESIQELSTTLLNEWGKLQMAYRIPKNTGDKSKKSTSHSPSAYGRSTNSPSESNNDDNVNSGDEQPPQQEEVDEGPLPAGWREAIDPKTNFKYYYHTKLNISKWERPRAEVPSGPRGPNLSSLPKGPKNRSNERPNGRNNKFGNGPVKKEDRDLTEREEFRLQQEKEAQLKAFQEKEKSLQEIILESQKEVEEKMKEAERLKQEKERVRERKRKRSANGKSSSPGAHKHIKTEHNGENKEIPLDAQWRKAFAKYVPNLIKKHEKEIGRENVKGCAKELVSILVAKESKRDNFHGQGPPKEFDNAKLKKMKDFSTSFMEKFLTKYRLKKQKKHQDPANA